MNELGVCLGETFKNHFQPPFIWYHNFAYILTTRSPRKIIFHLENHSQANAKAAMDNLVKIQYQGWIGCNTYIIMIYMTKKFNFP